jgi:hypothetical protein
MGVLMEVLDIILVVLLLAGAIFYLVKKSIGSESCDSGCGCGKKKTEKQ